MNWSDLATILVAVFVVMLFCGLLTCVFGRLFCRSRTWGGRSFNSRGFGCCCDWPDRRDDRGVDSARLRRSGPTANSEGR